MPSFTDYLKLLKLRLSLAVSFSATTGYLVNKTNPDPDFIFLVTGIFFLACGSAALNQTTENKQDAIMKRTMHRPVASNAISIRSAAALSVFLIIAGCLLLLLTGFRPFILGCSGVLLYNLLYTYLKRITLLAIIPGALVGSVPPLIGYASAGGTDLNDKILFFSVFMFLWQIPHFWLLLLRYGREYQEAGFKTIFDRLNINQIKLVTIFWLIISCVLLVVFINSEEVFKPLISIAVSILTAVFLVTINVSLYSWHVDSGLKYSFGILNLYSLLIMLFLIADSFVP